MDVGRTVPAQHCPAIERLTEGAVCCEDLRPDIEWGVLRARPAAPTTEAAKPPAAVAALEPMAVSEGA
jgi:DNA-binding transcriptional regulator YdaS (Cro superfamily)